MVGMGLRYQTRLVKRKSRLVRAIGVHGKPLVGGHLKVSAAVSHGELMGLGDLLGEAHAAGAVDTAILVDDDLGAQVFVPIATLGFFHAGVAAAVLVAVVLELALPGLITDGAIQGVVEEEEFHHRGPGIGDRR